MSAYQAFDPKVVWQPNPGPQTALIACPIYEVFYGGARGGGKTEGSIGDWLEHSSKYGQAAIGVFFRRTFKQLEEVVARTKEIFPQLGAKYFELPKAEWIMPGGGRLKFRYLEADKDAEEYQGHSYTRVYVEEVTNFPSPGPINKLRATLRSGAGVPCCLRLTGNPGGPGHQWVKKRFIDPSPLGWQVLTESFPDPRTGGVLTRERIYIPSRVTDNPKVGNEYVANLYQSGNAELVKAWLEGNWDIIQGAFFDRWDPLIHVVPRNIWQIIPKGTSRFRAMDWGSAKPFSIGWYAVADGTWGIPKRKPFRAGAFVKYREWYGSAGGQDPNVGLKLDAEVVARGIMSRENLFDEQIEYGVADPAIFVRDGGPSIMETFARQGVGWRRGDNKRIAGWNEMRHRLVGSSYPDAPLDPMLYFAECCEDSIRTIPILQHKENDPEDIDSEGEDHAGDETRYACMARPAFTPKRAGEGQGLSAGPRQFTIAELMARQQAKKSQRNTHWRD
jgi:hypothetical protein